jgi:hypothetical protein
MLKAEQMFQSTLSREDLKALHDARNEWREAGFPWFSQASEEMKRAIMDEE